MVASKVWHAGAVGVCHVWSRVVEHDDGIDFAVAAFREDGEWTVQDLAHDQLGDVETIAHALRRLPGDGGAVAMVAVDEDFFVHRPGRRARPPGCCSPT